MSNLSSKAENQTRGKEGGQERSAPMPALTCESPGDDACPGGVAARFGCPLFISCAV